MTHHLSRSRKARAVLAILGCGTFLGTMPLTASAATMAPAPAPTVALRTSVLGLLTVSTTVTTKPVIGVAVTVKGRKN